MQPSLLSSSRKILSYSLLGVIWLISFLMNNLQNFWQPNGTDEYAYMGIARRMIIFENKEALLAPFQGSPLLYSYWLGIVYKLTDVPLEILMRLSHGFILFLLIFFGYRLGQRFNNTIGLIVAFLIAFAFSPVFYPGQAYMVPSHFLSLSFLLIIPLLLDKKYKSILLILVLNAFLFWWGLPPLIAFLLIYFFDLRSKKHLFFIVGAFLLLLFLLSFQPFLDLSHFFQFASNLSNSNAPHYFSDLWSRFYFYIPALLGLIPLYSKFSTPRLKSAIHIALSLFFTSLLFYILLGTYTHLRMLFLFFLSLFLLIGVGYEFLSHITKNIFLKKLLSILFIFYFLLISYQTGRTYATDIATIPPMISSEVSAFEWLESQSVSKDLLISDYGTIVTSMFHVNTLDSLYFQNKPSKKRSSQEDKYYAYFDLGTPEMRRFYNILSEPIFSVESIEFLNKTKIYLGADQLFVIISPRTRQTIAIFDGSKQTKVHDSLVITRDANYSFIGEEKFLNSALFDTVYNNEETQIYQYTLE